MNVHANASLGPAGRLATLRGDRHGDDVEGGSCRLLQATTAPGGGGHRLARRRRFLRRSRRQSAARRGWAATLVNV